MIRRSTFTSHVVFVLASVMVKVMDKKLRASPSQGNQEECLGAQKYGRMKVKVEIISLVNMRFNLDDLSMHRSFVPIDKRPSCSCSAIRGRKAERTTFVIPVSQ